MFDPSKYLSLLKDVAPHVFFGLAIASGAVLFAPSAFTAALGLDPLLNEHRVWVGVIFLGSASLFTSAMGARSLRLAGQPWRFHQLRKSLTLLSPPERSVLATYLRRKTTTLSYPLCDGIVNGLEKKRILYRASNLGHPGSMEFDYNMQTWAWEHLRKHPELVKGPGDDALTAR